jgi:hypothetical protein
VVSEKEEGGAREEGKGWGRELHCVVIAISFHQTISNDDAYGPRVSSTHRSRPLSLGVCDVT